MTAPADILTDDDHARGCAGREYACTCGYDERVEDEIRRLRARVEELEGAAFRGPRRLRVPSWVLNTWLVICLLILGATAWTMVMH